MLAQRTFAQMFSFSRASAAATYFDSAGLMQTAAANQPRFDYDPITLALRGVLFEPARTNLALRSEDFAGAAWSSGTFTTVTSDATAAPTGLTTADAVIEDTSSGTGHYRSQSISFTSGNVYAFSCHGKEIGGSAKRYLHLVALTAAFGATYGAIFDLATGSVTFTSTSASAYTEQLPNGWWRCIMVPPAATATASAGFQVRLSNSSSSLANSYNGDGASGLYLWGVQVESTTLGFASSYIPTTTATVLRNLEVLTVDLTNVFNAAVGSCYIEAMLRNGGPNIAGSGVRSIWQIDGGASTDRMLLRVDANNGQNVTNRVLNASATQASLSFGFTPLVAFKHAFAFGVNDFAASLNGAAVLTDSNGSLPAGSMTTLRLGSEIGASGVCGWIRKFKYYRRRITDAELQRLTA